MRWGSGEGPRVGNGHGEARKSEAYFRKRGWYIGHVDWGYHTTEFSFETSTKISNFISQESKPSPACLFSKFMRILGRGVAWRGVARRWVENWILGLVASFFSFSFVGGCLFRIYVKLKLSVWSKDRSVCAYLIWSHAIVWRMKRSYIRVKERILEWVKSHIKEGSANKSNCGLDWHESSHIYSEIDRLIHFTPYDWFFFIKKYLCYGQWVN